MQHPVPRVECDQESHVRASKGWHHETHPEHWTDEWHEEDGGDDVRGDRPRFGVTLLKAEMDGLSYKGGYEASLFLVLNLIYNGK